MILVITFSTFALYNIVAPDWKSLFAESETSLRTF